MKAVNIAELKANLSSYLDKVAEGQEIIVRNRKKPVARIIPFETGGADQEQMILVAEGKLRPPIRRGTASFWKDFWSAKRPGVRAGDSVQAILADRNER
jgi:prevent-host-death family protein